MMLPFDRQLEHATPLPSQVVATHAVGTVNIGAVCNLDSLGYRSVIFQSVLCRECTGPIKNVCITPYFALYWLPFITGHYQIYTQFRT